MKLNIVDRLVLMQILPQQGNAKTLKLVKEFHGFLGLSDEELKDFEVKQDAKTGRINWNVEKEKDKEVEINKKINDLIVKSFERMNNEEKLPMEYLEVYEKFIKG